MPKGDKIWVEMDSSGILPQFVLKRSHSHHGHHHHHKHHKHHHHHHDDRADITRDELNALLDRERMLREVNDSLTRENSALKANWQACDAELRRLQPIIPQLQAQIRHLEHENRELRRSVDSSGDAAERLRELRIKYTRVKNENEGLTQTVRHLQAQLRDAVDDRVGRLLEKVQTLKEEVREWMRRYENVSRGYEDQKNRCDRLRANLDTTLEKNARLEDENERLRRRLYHHGHHLF